MRCTRPIPPQPSRAAGAIQAVRGLRIAGIFLLVYVAPALRCGARFPCPCREGKSLWRRDMSYGGSGNGGWRNESAPNYQHAFDPYAEPDLFRHVLMRRVIAFVIDVIVLSVPVALGYLFIALFGLITLGLGWALFWLAWPASIVWAIVYYGSTLGGPHSATI